MVVVKLSCGLGNQLFQYATGRALSLQQGSRLFIDTRSYQIDPTRACDIVRLNIAARVSPRIVGWLADEPKVNIARRALGGIATRLGIRFIRDNENGFSEDLLRARMSCYLSGYWLSPKYFSWCRSTLLNELTLKEPLRPELSDLSRRMAEQESVCVHMRRGDYASNAVFKATHGALTAAYYATAVSAIRDISRADSFYIFSDDPDWAEDHAPKCGRTTVVSGRYTNGPLEDFALMASCRNFVVANSTFSWWAAWAGLKEGGRVVCPRPFFRSRMACEADLIPVEWTTVDADFEQPDSGIIDANLHSEVQTR